MSKPVKVSDLPAHVRTQVERRLGKRPKRKRAMNRLEREFACRDVLVILPIRTPSCTNLREHWTKRAKRAKAHRLVARLKMEEKVERLDHPSMPAAVIVRLTRIAPRPLDDDNLRGALKAVRDGVADALAINDRDDRAMWLYDQRRGRPREHIVMIELEAQARTLGKRRSEIQR